MTMDITTTTVEQSVQSDSNQKSTLFTETDGSPIKFFIQSSLPEDLKESLATDVRVRLYFLRILKLNI